MGKWFGLTRDTFSAWSRDKAPRLAAALAYYTAFSIAPLLVIAIAVAGLIFGEEAASGQVYAQLEGLLGPDGAGAVQTLVQGASRPSAGIIATLLGFGALLFGAAGLFGQIQDAMNTVWGIKPKEGLGIWGMIRQRFFSFGMVAGVAFLLLVSLLASAALAAVNTWFSNLLPGADIIWQVVNFAVTLVVTAALFAIMFRFVPDAKVAWKDVWIGAILTAILFNIGKFALGVYLGNASYGSTYGAAGSFVLLLVWVYYSAQIVLFGAEFTKVYALQYGSKIRPEPQAEIISPDVRAQQGMDPVAPQTAVSPAGASDAPVSRLAAAPGSAVAGLLGFVVGFLVGGRQGKTPAR